jgi:EmrB/QacA subfamily drug resistance transporter
VAVRSVPGAPPTRDGAAGAAAGSPAGAGWLLPLAVLVAGYFVSILNSSTINVAIPTIQDELGGTTDQVQWISTGYTMGLGVIVPLTGWLGDRYGLGRVFLFAVLGFVAGSVLCGLAPSLDLLIAFRILQAVGGGMVPVLAMAMLYRIVPRDRIGTAMGFLGLGVAVAPALGPTVAGYLVEYVNWRVIFWMNVPVGILSAVGAYLVLPRLPGRAGQRFDVPGFVTVAGGLFALLLAFSEGESWGWTSYAILLLITAGLLSLASFVVIELSVSQPLLDLRVLRYWPFTNSLLLIAVISIGLFAVVFYIPLFLQEGEDLDAFRTGLLLLPPVLPMVAMMPISGRLYDRIGPRWPAAIGLLVVAYATYLMHHLSTDTSTGQVATWMALRYLGLGLGYMPVMTAGLAAVPTALVSRASALNNVVQRVSQALSLAVLTPTLEAQQAQQYVDRSGLLPAVAPGFPALQHVVAGGRFAVVEFANEVQVQAFAGALDDLFLLVTALTVVCVFLALMLRSGPARAAAEPAPPAPAPLAAAPDGRQAPNRERVSGEQRAVRPASS